MNEINLRRLARCLAVWLTVTVGVALLADALLPLDVSLTGRFDELLVRLSSWALLACAAWLWIVTTVVIATALRAPSGVAPRSVRGVPAPIRRLVLAACGVAITTGVAAPALATPGPVHVDQRDHSGRVVLTGLPFPDRATADTPRPARPHAARPHAQRPHAARPHAQRPHADQPRAPRADLAHGRVVVREGDSLWSIAAAHLPSDASDAQVATAWHQIYERNRDAIGDDPDLLTPGQHLVLPNLLG